MPSSFRILRQVLDRLEDSQDRTAAARELPLRDSGRPRRAGEGDRADPRRRGLEALPVGVRRRRRPDAADDDRPGRGAAQPHLAADAVGHRRRRRSGAQGRGQRAAPVHRVQAQPAHCRRWSTATQAAQALKTLLEDNAPYNAKVTFHADGRRRARIGRDRLERAEPRAVARGRAATRRRRRSSARPAATSARAARSR